MTYSSAIDAVISAAEAEGNRVVEVSSGWNKVREVVHMDLPLSSELQTTIMAEHKLRFWSADATPHNKAEQGFTDDFEKVSISFPRKLR